MTNPLEGPKSAEMKESPKAKYRVRLHIIRHGKKAGGNDVPPEVDLAMKLRPEGRLQAREKGMDLQTKGGVTSGSTRARSRETAMHMAHANSPEVTGDETYDELVAKIGSEPWTNRGLDMPFSKDDPEFPMINQKANEGTLFKWFAEVDDEIAARKGDRSTSFYGTQVRSIGSIIDRFTRVAMKMADRAERAQEKDERVETEREQVMGTHGGVNESFLAELVRRSEGEEERKRFLETIPNGVGETQGSDIEIVATAGETDPLIRVRFTVGKEGNQYHYDRFVTLQTVQNIIKDFSPKESAEVENASYEPK